MSGHARESIFMDVCHVPSGRQQEVIDGLLDALREFRLVDGFIEGGILANSENTKVAWYLRMESAEDGQRATEHQDIREQIGAVESIGSSHADVFERLWVISPPSGRGPVEVTYGSF